MRRKGLRWAGLGLAGWLVVVFVIASLERSMLFPAPALSRAQLARLAAREGASEIEVVARDGTRLYGWRLPPVGPDRGGLVLTFCGNGSTVGAPVERYAALRGAGFAVLHVNYRGYPGSDGTPSEAGLLDDAAAAWAEARRTHEAGQVVVHGKSLGGGVAVGLLAALDETLRALVLESTFTSAVRVGKEALPWLPVGLLMRNRFDSLARAPRLEVPALVLHGGADEMIGPHHGRELARALQGARYVEIARLGHNDDLLAHPEGRAAFLALVGP